MKTLWFLLLLALAVPAPAFVTRIDTNGNVLHWDLVNSPASVHTNVVNTNTHAIRFFIAADGFSVTNTTAELNAVRSCFDQWQAISGTHLKFEDAGLIGPGADIDTSDHTNVVFWVKSGTQVNRGHQVIDIGGALGFTSFSFFGDSVMNEADIVLNAFYYQWFTDITDTNNTGYFVDGVLLHEIGHFIGLLHSPVGGATMLAVGGDTSEAVSIGLSQDEIAAARYLYPAAGHGASLAAVTGVVTNATGTAIFGAVVIAEDAAGNVIAGAMTRTNGQYLLPAMPPGSYQLRVTPLDPSNAGPTLVRGMDVDFNAFSSANTAFRPSAPQSQNLIAGATNTVNFLVVDGTPPFFISRLRPPTTDTGTYGQVNSPIAVRPGQSNLTVGVYGANLPANNATLTVTGDGISLGAVSFNSIFSGFNGLSVVINVASNATPGLRSFVVTRNSDGAQAYANGFIEVSPPVMDNNFDGLDDLFQRRYFPRFTAAAAAPTADPDQDGYNNLAEYIAGSNPNDPDSFLQIQSVTQTAGGTTIKWPSEAGKKYLVLSRPQVTGVSWVTNGPPVIATTNLTQFTDSPVSGAIRFYRVQAVP